MAADHDPSVSSDEGTIAFGPDARVRTDAPADATCDIAPAAPPPTDATCDIAPTALPADPGTCAFEPTAPPADPGTCAFEPAPIGTCDFTADMGSAGATQAKLKSEQTTRIQQPGETVARPGAGNDVTGEFRPEPDGNMPTAEVRRGAADESLSRRTAHRSSAAGLTHPVAPDGDGKSSPKSAGRYLFKKFHAKGGMGEVWLAEDADIGRPVALKRILKGRENQQPQFVREARVTGQLEHPGVIPVHELAVDESGQPYYVMKFVNGKTLKEVIEEYHAARKANPKGAHEVEWLRLMSVFLNLCQTIAYAHSRGVIHRDIKPDNVMVGAYGETLVLDWGLAKVVSEPESKDAYAAVLADHRDDTMATMAGTIKGSPLYFPPEAASGQMELVDQNSDTYLLGATLYHMVVGRPPRESKKISKLLEEAKWEAPVAPIKLDPSVPRPLSAVCVKALALKKEDRYASAAALAEEVQRYLAGETISAYQETFAERTWRWVRRHRVALSRAAALAVLGAVMLTAFLFIRNAEAQRIEAQEKAADLTRKDEARQQIKDFRNLMEEARFYAASADPVAEYAPTLDAAKAQAKANAALAIADRWGAGLEQMPLAEQRAELKKDLYDLLLETAQLKSRHSGVDEVKQAQATLERAAAYHAPTQSYYRLRARVHEALGEHDEAVADLKQAADPHTPKTSLDHYLLGEQQRVESLKPVKDDARDGKQAGLKGLLARRKLLAKAIEHYRQALRTDPDHYWSHYQLGSCYSGLGAYAEAAEALGTCVALRADVPYAYGPRGLALAQLQDRDEDALADLNQAIRLDPEFRPARLNRAMFYWKRQKKYKDAEADFASVLAPPQEKRLREALLARGQMYMDQAGDDKNPALYDRAAADFAELATTDLRMRTLHLHRTRMYLVKQEYDEAIASLTAFLAVDKDFNPDGAAAHEQRGRELRLLASEFPPEAKNRREAVYLLAHAQLQQAVKLGGESPSLFEELGTIEEKLAELQPDEAAKRMQQAIAAYSSGIKLAPAHPKLLVKRGWVHIIFSQAEKAKTDFAAAVAADPTIGEAHTGLGYSEALLKSPSEARRQAYLAVLYGAGDYLVLHNVACIFGALSTTDKTREREYHDLAIDHLRRAIDVWKMGGKTGPNEITLIGNENETAMPPALRARPEFKKLIQQNSP